MGSAFSIQDLLRRITDALLGRRAAGEATPPDSMERERSLRTAHEALSAVREPHEWRSIPSLLFLLSHDDAVVRGGAARLIDGLAASIPSQSLLGFERMVRGSALQTYFWYDVSMDWVAKEGWPPRVTALFTMHPSGYIREAMLRRLAAEGSVAIVLPFFLLRLNDWVKEVRTVAEEAVTRLLRLGHASAWVPSLGFLDHLRLRSRADHQWLSDAVTALFLDPASRSELMNAARSEDRLIARWAFQAAMTLPDGERAAFVSPGLKHGDPVVRLLAAKAARAWIGCPDRETLLAHMATDRFMPIRREALYAALDLHPERRRAMLQTALLDRHASMRNAARFYLRESPAPSAGPLDVRRFYLEAIARSDPSTRAAAIAGAGECGDKADADALAPFAEDDRSCVASAAIRAVATLDRDHRVAWLVDRLGDPRPAVAKEAGRTLETLGDAVPVAPLRRVLLGDFHSHSRRAALRILLRRHPYDAVADALAAAASGDAALARIGSDFIARAVHRPVTSDYGPSQAQKAAAQDAARSLRAPLPETLRWRLSDVMDVRFE